MHISFGENFQDTTPKQRELTFEQFVKLVTNLPVHTGHLHWTQYTLAGKLERGRSKNTRWFIPASFVRPERRADAISSLSAFVCDFDDGCIKRADIERFGRTHGCRFVAWTSYSNGLDGKEKWRVFYPYKEPIAPSEHQKVYEWFNNQFGGHLDPRCGTVSQLWYLRGRPQGAPPSDLFGVYEGSDFDARSCGHDPASAPTRDLSSLGALAPSLVSRLADNDDLTSRGPTSLGDIKSALRALDPNLYEDYTEWLNIGMAIYDGTKGSAAGLEIFNEWSSTVPGYDGPDACEAKWQSFGGRAGLSRITVASLFKQALTAGWVADNSQQPHLPPPPVSLPAPQQVINVQASVGSSGPAVLPVLPLIMTAPVPMPARFRAHPQAFATQKQIEDPDTGNTRWTTCIAGFQIISLDLLKTIDEGRHTAELIVQNAIGQERATFRVDDIASPAEFQGLLAGYGIITTKEEFKSLQEIIVEWLKKIQESQRVKRSFTHLGWMEKDTQHIGFALGTTAYYADGSQETGIKVQAGGGTTIAKHYIPQGDLQIWKSISQFLSSQGRVELMAILSTAFGSPLMKFSGHSGAVVSIVSTASGVGKSTALSLAQSVWGNPKSAMHSAADTVLSLSSKMGFTKDLPAYWDDIKGEKTFEQFASTIYQITQGKEKSRLSQTAELREVQNWNCLAVVAANDSLIEITKRYGKGSDAGSARIFEIRLEARPEMTQQATFFDACTTNYGRAGEVYAAWLAANPDKARKLVEQLSDHLHTDLQVESEERFWVAAVAVMVAGAQIAKMLGLVDFDVKGLLTFLKARFRELRGTKTEIMAEAGPERQIADLIYDHQPTTLLVDAIPRFNKGKPMVLRAPKNGEVDIMLVRDDGILRLRKAKLHDWCRLKGFSSDTLRTRLEQMGCIKEKNVDPMAGTAPYSQGSRTACYDVDLKTLGIQTGENDGVDTQ